MTPRASRDMRFRLLAVALLGLLAALARPEVTASRLGFDLLFVTDITGSMNARDQTLEGRAVSRLEFVKHQLRTLLARLPCGSRAGLGIFTERRSFLLFEPVETCGNYAAVDGAIASLDWRMAWEGDSRIASGLDSAIAIAGDLGSTLVFLTDGQEAPPPPASGPPPFERRPGEVNGVIVGVGGTVPVPIPRFDDQGHEIGFFQAADVPHESRLGPPPADAAAREGWHPRNAPFGAVPLAGTEHLTSVREAYLQRLAQLTGLGYAHLTGTDAFEAALRRHATGRPIVGAVDLRPIPASLALLALLSVYGLLPVLERLRLRRPIVHPFTGKG